MKAIRIHEFGEPEVMNLEEIDEPAADSSDVVIKVQAAGVNPVDTYIRSGIYPVKPKLPYTPGMDVAGVVESVGESVEKLKPSDRVYTFGTISGGYAEKVVCTISQVHHLPENITFSEGAALGVPYGASYRALFNMGKAQPGEIVLVHGASGAVGTAAVQLAKGAGMKVIGSAGTEKGMELVKQQGADLVVSHKDPERFRKIIEWTEDRGVDVVVEMLANENLNNDLKVMAMNGRVVVVGCRGDVSISPRLTMIHDVSIRGMILMNAGIEKLSEIYKKINEGLESGSLKPVVGTALPLSDAVKAHHQVIEQSAYGKIVLTP
ncbi:MAG: NADPH:quinone reductase [Planctomycetota bacterium]|jgi:NADPH2:quinone reductase